MTNCFDEGEVMGPIQAGYETQLQLRDTAWIPSTLAVHAFPPYKLINGSLLRHTPHTKHQCPAPQRVKFDD